MATTILPEPEDQEPTVSRGAVDLVLKMIEEEQEKLAALLIVLASRLAEWCNEGGEPPDDAPLIEWRFAQLAKEKAESTQLMTLARASLGFKEAAHANA